MVLPHPPESLTDEDRKLLYACMCEIITREIFQSHFYEWNGEIYLQMSGCPMGYRTSSPIRRLLTDDTIEYIREIEDISHTLNTLDPI